MYAIFELSGFQFRAEEGTVVRVPHLRGTAGKTLEISDVLLIKSKESAHVGTPTVEGATIKAEIIGDGKSDKVTVYKFKRRTKYRRTIGHRQNYSEIRIKKIVAPAN